MDGADFPEQAVEIAHQELAGAVAGSAVRVGVDLDEERVDPDRHRRPRERRDHRAVAIAGIDAGTRVLRRVCGVETDRRVDRAC